MMMDQRRRSYRLPLLLVVAFAGSLALVPTAFAGGHGARPERRGAGSSASASVHERARQDAHRRLERFGDRIRGFRVESTTPLGGKIAKAVLARGSGEHERSPNALVLRAPQEADRKVMKNAALHILATQLGMSELVPRGANTELTIPNVPMRAMAMEYAGDEFEAGDVAPEKWRERVSDRVKLVAATMDVIAEHRDRKMANLMLNEHGQVRLVDPDTTFGQGATRRMFISNFFPGRRLSFDAERYRKFDDLPSEIREVVQFIAESSSEELQAFYGLEGKHVERMKKRAQRIIDVGLTEAVRELSAEIEGIGLRGTE
jgi:hypothetical protein